MTAAIPARTLRSGNSVAVRLLRAFGIAAGVDLRVREEGGRSIPEPAEAPGRTIDLTGMWDCPSAKPLTPEEREFEEHKLGSNGRLVRRD